MAVRGLVTLRRAILGAVAAQRDPRVYQILVLSGLLAFGLSARAFDIPFSHMAATIAAALGVQALGATLIAGRFEAKSALITSLSLILLLRADHAGVMAAAAAIAVGSKFALRVDGKHVFNPANAGIVALLIISSNAAAPWLVGMGLDDLRGAAWTTPGQWGAALWFAAILAGVGVFVTTRAARLDAALVFLGVYAALLFIRTLWLGDPFAIPLNRLQNGALALFAFFMITDPKTTPDGPRARALFAGLTALGAHILTYYFHNADGVFYALALACIVRPLIERFDPAQLYRWPDALRSARARSAPERAPAE